MNKLCSISKEETRKVARGISIWTDTSSDDINIKGAKVACATASRDD